MRTFIIMLAFLIGPSTAFAQHPWWGYGCGYGGGADTATSANLRGFGQALHGEADRLRALGEYHQRIQDAYSQYLDNNNKRIRYYWQIRDDYKARQAAKPNYLDRLEKRLDMAERRAELEKREEELIKKGILPEKPKGYTYNGITYESYDEFKETETYAKLKAERIAEGKRRRAEYEAEQAAKKQREEEAIAFLRMWSKMDFIARQNYSRLSPEEKARRIEEFKNPDLRWKRLEDEQNRRFYENRPYLIPSAGKGGLPPLPSDWNK